MKHHFLLLNLSLCACSGTASPEPDDGRSLQIRWIQGHEDDSWSRSKAGLWWSLSQLGAVPNADESALVVNEESETWVEFSLDFDEVGLSESALITVDDVLDELKHSDPYQRFGSADLGRVLMRLLYEPWRYYAITGACTQISDWQRQRLGDQTASFSITESMLIDGHRLLQYRPDPAEMGQIAWLAQEGTGSLEDGSFITETFEVVDVLPNGQPRYALYDASGTLIPAPAEAESPIGQPGRCMWCHEQHLMGTVEQPELKGSVSWSEFSAQINTQQDLIDGFRDEDQSATNFADTQVHAWSEQLVETFLFPSVARVAQEWQMGEPTVQALIDSRDLTLHTSEEYPEFGPLLYRSEVDELAKTALADPNYQPLPTLPSSRNLDLRFDVLQDSLGIVTGCP